MLFTAALPAAAWQDDALGLDKNFKNISKMAAVFAEQSPIVTPAPAPENALTAWAKEYAEGTANTNALLSILSDKNYLSSDNVYTDESCRNNYDGPLECELKALNPILPFASFTQAEAKQINHFIITQLSCFR